VVLLGVCAACRALRTQQFLAFTAADLANRDAKQKALLQEFEASRKGKLVSKAELDDFYQRLQVTGALMLVLPSWPLAMAVAQQPWLYQHARIVAVLTCVALACTLANAQAIGMTISP
jgi:hypothetical protein